MRKILTALAILCMLMAVTTSISCSSRDRGEQNQEKTETSTPAKIYQMRDAFSGKLVNRRIYTDYEGKRIYFCCPNSRDDFLKDPEKYINKFKELGITLQDAPTPKGNR
jgi:hypothetical protein